VSFLETISLTISEWSATLFSLTFSESTGAVCTEDSLCHRRKQFRGLFLTGRRLSFPLLFMSQQGLCALTNPLVTSGTFSVMISERAATLFFFIVSESTGAVQAEDSFCHLWKQFP